MILTITPSPAFDLTYQIDSLVDGAVNRAQGSSLEASGKGINVSRALADQGIETVAIAPNSTSALGELWLGLAEFHHAVATSKTMNEPRINTSIVESSDVTKINENLKPLSESELNDLISITRDSVRKHNPSWVVLSGSINPANSATLIGAVVGIARDNGSKVAIDTSGSALREAIDAKPDFIKPNLEELQEYAGDFNGSSTRFMEAVEELATHINGTVICSNGAGVGYASNQRELLEVTPHAITGANSVGAGDAAVAGYVAAESNGANFVTATQTAMTWARMACLNPETAGLKGSVDLTNGGSVRTLKGQSLSA